MSGARAAWRVRPSAGLTHALLAVDVVTAAPHRRASFPPPAPQRRMLSPPSPRTGVYIACLRPSVRFALAPSLCCPGPRVKHGEALRGCRGLLLIRPNPRHAPVGANHIPLARRYGSLVVAEYTLSVVTLSHSMDVRPTQDTQASHLRAWRRSSNHK